MLEPRPEHREGMGSRPRGREGVALYKSEDSAAVHGGMGADRPGERWVGGGGGWEQMDSFCFLSEIRSWERGGGRGVGGLRKEEG